MPTEEILSSGHPMLVAWKAYASGDAYKNSLKWAAFDEHREGSMWAAFTAGYEAAQQDARLPKDAGVTTETEEKFCTTCGHSESRHNTPGSFCKHCPCTQFTVSGDHV
jgi:hypothetical protein